MKIQKNYSCNKCFILFALSLNVAKNHTYLLLPCPYLLCLGSAFWILFLNSFPVPCLMPYSFIFLLITSYPCPLCLPQPCFSSTSICKSGFWLPLLRTCSVHLELSFRLSSPGTVPKLPVMCSSFTLPFLVITHIHCIIPISATCNVRSCILFVAQHTAPYNISALTTDM